MTIDNRNSKTIVNNINSKTLAKITASHYDNGKALANNSNSKTLANNTDNTLQTEDGNRLVTSLDRNSLFASINRKMELLANNGNIKGIVLNTVITLKTKEVSGKNKLQKAMAKVILTIIHTNFHEAKSHDKLEYLASLVDNVGSVMEVITDGSSPAQCILILLGYIPYFFYSLPSCSTIHITPKNHSVYAIFFLRKTLSDFGKTLLTEKKHALMLFIIGLD